MRFLAVAAVFFLAGPVAWARPVLIELFTSSQLSAARSAEQAAARLVLENATGELHLLVYQINKQDKDCTLEGMQRAQRYNVTSNRLPVAIFNGTSRIEGSKPDLYPAYREQFLQKQAGVDRGTMQSGLHLHADAWISAATYRLFPEPSFSPYSIHAAFVEDRSLDKPGIVRTFSAVVDATDVLAGTVLLRRERLPNLPEIKASTIWWLQDTKSGEVLHSSRAWNRAPFQWDANGDGEWDRLDVFWLIFLWGTGAPAADANRDGRVNQVDLLRFLAVPSGKFP